MIYNKYFFALLLVIIIAPNIYADGIDQKIAGFDEYIRRGMEQWKIPGLAVAVVKDDDVVYMKGFGLRKLGETEKVDEHTLFGIASLSKAFTGAAIGMLVDEGKLHWDDPVVDHLPHFQLSDRWVTQEITVRDLLIHNSGLGRMIGNRLQFMTRKDRDELMYRLRYLEPERSFRSSYVYSNMLYMAAGQLIPAVTGMSWDDFIKERIFQPLEMELSNTSINDVPDNGNAAYPHQEIRGEVQVIPRRNFDNVGPAASINASVHEMVQWMRLHLGTPGVINETEIIQSETMRVLHHPQTVIPVENPKKEFAAYGMGWGIRLYRDRIISRHAGAVDGMNSFIALVHEENLGVVILTNIFNDFMYALANHVIDSILGVSDEQDWQTKYLNEYEQRYREVKEKREEIHNSRVANTPASVPPDSLAGQYRDLLYGDVTVSVKDNNVSVIFWNDETLIADLEHWHYDTYRAVWRNPAQREKFVWFDLDKIGDVAYLNIEFNLRPNLIQIGAYPSDYTRVVRYRKVE